MRTSHLLIDLFHTKPISFNSLFKDESLYFQLIFSFKTGTILYMVGMTFFEHNKIPV
jgi:hypothetical protein